ncbi:transcriptional regulator [Candidatus Thorarchaeota archaeon]|nr:MAG: transcriptional regulator [Candidatus Thorarchaeota archaeon]
MVASKTNESNTSSPMSEMFSHLGRPCAVPLIFSLGERSYSTDIHELQSSINLSSGKKLNSSTISKCLFDLTQIGLVEGTMHAQSPLKAEYWLTTTGQQLYKHLLQIRHLAERASFEPNLLESMSAC